MDDCFFFFTSTHTFSFFFALCQQTVSDSFGFNLTYFGGLRTDLTRRDVSGSKFSDRLPTMSAFRSGRHQHGQLLQGGGGWRFLMEVVTPQTGRGEGSERHIIRGNALHCEGHVEGQLLFICCRQKNAKYQPSLKPQEVSLWWIQRVIFSLCHEL